MTDAVLIVAAGRGRRAGPGQAKQYREIAGMSVLRRTVLAFAEHPEIDLIQCVIHPDDSELYAQSVQGLPKLLPVAQGGAERQDSVRLGLEAMAGESVDKVLIHDAARPFISASLISDVLHATGPEQGAVAALPMVDTLRLGEEKLAKKLICRDNLWRSQTPQGFAFSGILAAHQQSAGQALTDDVEVARQAGLEVRLILGQTENIKLTTPEDFQWAERWLAGAYMVDPPLIRVGTGFDVHKFGPGDHLMICGVKISHTQGVIAHSDGDVGLHALTDALLGALALGDIGQHFPPSDSQWKDCDSAFFVEETIKMLAARNARIGNLDLTLICEKPKIGPHVTAMRQRIAEICRIDDSQINIKATTTERLGFTGREEGIAAMASATVIIGMQT